MAKEFAERYLDLPPIAENEIRNVERLAGKNIFVLSSSGAAICGSCGETVHIRAKHKDTIECPNCNKKMTVQHVWRMSKKIHEFDWITVSQTLDEKCVVIRFVLADRRPQMEDYTGDSIESIKGTPWNTAELARIYYHEDYAAPGIYQLKNVADERNAEGIPIKWRSEWQKDSAGYFKPDTYSIACRNPMWCMYAYQDTNRAIEEFSKLDCFKYYPLENIWDENRSIFQIHYLMRTARINEKLHKMGLDHLVERNEEEYRASDLYGYKGRAWLYGDKPVLKALKLNKAQFEVFKRNPDKTVLRILQHYPDVTEEEMHSYPLHLLETTAKYAKRIKVTRDKFRKYLEKQNIHLYEYTHYLDMLNQLPYDRTDLYYSMPKDFHKADKKVSDEFDVLQTRKRAMARFKDIEKQAKIDEKIYKISNIIRDCEELRFWTHGSNGLKVIVPESVGELVDEGIKLHNCLSSYAEKIADKETLIFFIRKLDEESKEYVAMEWREGERVQIRFDHNIAVEDEKILQFADAFAAKLKEIDVMKQLRRVA